MAETDYIKKQKELKKKGIKFRAADREYGFKWDNMIIAINESWEPVVNPQGYQATVIHGTFFTYNQNGGFMHERTY